MCNRLISLYTKQSFCIMQVFHFPLCCSIHFGVHVRELCSKQGAVYETRIDSMKMYILLNDNYRKNEFPKKGNLLQSKSYMHRPVNGVRVTEKRIIC